MTENKFEKLGVGDQKSRQDHKIILHRKQNSRQNGKRQKFDGEQARRQNGKTTPPSDVRLTALSLRPPASVPIFTEPIAALNQTTHVAAFSATWREL